MNSRENDQNEHLTALQKASCLSLWLGVVLAAYSWPAQAVLTSLTGTHHTLALEARPRDDVRPN